MIKAQSKNSSAQRKTFIQHTINGDKIRLKNIFYTEGKSLVNAIKRTLFLIMSDFKSQVTDLCVKNSFR